MRRLKLWLGMVAVIIFVAGQAWGAVVSAPSGLGLQSTNATGNYSVSVGSSYTAGVTYVVEEATDAAFTQDYSSNSLGTARIFRVSGKTDNTYYYRAKAVKGVDSSPWTVVKSIVVTTKVAPPSGLGLQSTSLNGSYTVSIGPAVDTSVSYELAEATDPGFTENPASYTLGSVRYKKFTGKDASMYYYRARATKSGFAPSDWTAVGAIAVGNTAILPYDLAG